MSFATARARASRLDARVCARARCRARLPDQTREKTTQSGVLEFS